MNLTFIKNYAGRFVETSDIYSYTPYYKDGKLRMGGIAVSTSLDESDKNMHILTGWMATVNGIQYLQIFGYSIGADGEEYMQPEYIKNSNKVRFLDDYTDPDYPAETVIDKMIKNNKRILENNIVCARFSSKLNIEERQLLYDLQKRLEVRNEALLNNQLIASAKTAAPQGYALLANYLDEFMSNGKVGIVVSQTAIIVVSAVVLASVSAAAYFAYVAYATESMKDVKFSDELTATLASKLTAEEFEQLKSETAGIVTKARLKASFGSAYTVVKVALFALLGYMAYSYIKPNIVTSKKKKNDKVRRTS